MDNLPSFEGNNYNEHQTNDNTLASAAQSNSGINEEISCTLMLQLSNVDLLSHEVNCLKVQLNAQAI